MRAAVASEKIGGGRQRRTEYALGVTRRASARSCMRAGKLTCWI